MRILTQKLPDNSYGVRIWPVVEDGEGIPKDRDDYELVCVIVPIDDKTCEITHAMGSFKGSILQLLGLKVAELGYTKIIFKRSVGGPATKWAKYIKTEDGFDHYEVDLVEAISKANPRVDYESFDSV